MISQKPRVGMPCRLHYSDESYKAMVVAVINPRQIKVRRNGTRAEFDRYFTKRNDNRWREKGYNLADHYLVLGVSDFERNTSDD